MKLKKEILELGTLFNDEASFLKILPVKFLFANASLVALLFAKSDLTPSKLTCICRLENSGHCPSERLNRPDSKFYVNKTSLISERDSSKKVS